VWNSFYADATENEKRLVQPGNFFQNLLFTFIDNWQIFTMVIVHFAKNHFVKSHKVDLKISGWSLCRKALMAFWCATYGVPSMVTKAFVGLG